jgi:hypothetical protein
MRYEDLISFIESKEEFPENLAQLLEQKKYILTRKGYGTPELEMQFLHKIFMRVQAVHPEFHSLSWEQHSEYNDEYHSLNVYCFVANAEVEVDTDLLSSFNYFPYKEISSKLHLEVEKDAALDEIAFAKQHNLPIGEHGLSSEDWNKYYDSVQERYAHLKIPCLKMMIIMQLLRINFSMYYFLYVFGDFTTVTINEEGITIAKRDLHLDSITEGMGFNYL